MRNRFHPWLWLATTFLALSNLQAQKPAQKFNDAIKKSEQAAEIVAKLAGLSDKGISTQLINASEAIGIFPCHKIDLLLEHAVLCHGSISRHTKNGWSLPAFYKFSGGGLGRPDPALGDSNAMILLFTDSQSIDALARSITFKDEKKARPGIVGPLTSEQLSGLVNGAHVIAYSLRKNELRGETLGSGFWKGIVLGPDEHVNQGLFRAKAFEVLSGKDFSTVSFPSEIRAFQKALEEHYHR